MHVQKPRDIEYVGRGLYRSENWFSDPGQGQYIETTEFSFDSMVSSVFLQSCLTR